MPQPSDRLRRVVAAERFLQQDGDRYILRTTLLATTDSSNAVHALVFSFGLVLLVVTAVIAVAFRFSLPHSQGKQLRRCSVGAIP